MTNYQSTTFYVEDSNSDSAAFTPLADNGEHALKMWRTAFLPDGQPVEVNVLFTDEDVRGLQAFLNDQFGRGQARIGAHRPYSADEDATDSLTEGGFSAGIEQFAADNPSARQTPPLAEARRRCPHISNGVPCSYAEHGSTPHSYETPGRPDWQAHQDAQPVFPQTPAEGVSICARTDVHHHMQDSTGVHWVHDGTEEACPLPDNHYPVQVTHQAEAADPGPAFSPDDTADTAAKPESAPKKSGRRKKEEIAYDRALEAFRKQPNSQLEYTELTKAAEALRKRFPNAERLTAYDLHVQHQDIGYLSPEYKSEPGDGNRPPEAPQQAVQPGPQFAPEPTAQAQPAPFVPPATTQHPDGLPLPAPEQVSPEEAAAAQAFPCGHVSEMSQRPCIRPAGHELANPPKPHIYAPLEQGQSLPVPSFIPPMPATAPAQHGPGHSAAGFPIEQPNFTVTPVADGQGFSQQQIPPFQIPQPVGGPAAAGPQTSAQVLSFQVPPTPAIEGAELQPPAPAAPPWSQQ